MSVASGGERLPLQRDVSRLIDELPIETRGRLLDGGTPRTISGGEIFFRPTDAPPCAGLIVKGLARVYLEAADGRKLTFRYARPGFVVGVVSALIGRSLPVNIQAITDLQFIEIDLGRLEGIGQEDAGFSWALATEVSQRLLETIDALAETVFGTVQGRLAHHLLDLADDVDADGNLVVRATHQVLADSVGTVREVVARNLADFRAAGYLVTHRGLILIAEPDALAACTGQWLPRRR